MTQRALGRGNVRTLSVYSYFFRGIFYIEIFLYMYIECTLTTDRKKNGKKTHDKRVNMLRVVGSYHFVFSHLSYFDIISNSLNVFFW